MRIGVMLRALEEKQGIGIYSLNLMDELLPLDPQTEYVLFYKNPAFLGRYASHPNVTEKLVSASGKFEWDQIRMPLEARKTGVDILFHTKFTVPFFTGRKTVMTVHGASWFVHPELYSRADIAYINAVMPLYCRKADLIIANSELTRQDFIRILKAPPEKIRTIRLGANPSFKVVNDASALSAIRSKYKLPEHFIFSVIKYDPRKNFKNLIAGFRLLRKRLSCKLVVAGIGCEKYIPEYRLAEDGTLDNMTFLGWVDQAELPLLYNMADCMLFPSVYEEFGIPTCEAMACGCPVVISKTGALPEIADDAGEIVDPFDPASIADGLEHVLADPQRRAAMREKGLNRARIFTWKRCAEETKEALHGFDNRQTLRTVAIGAVWRVLRIPFLILATVFIPRLMGNETYSRYAYFGNILLMCEAFNGLGNLQIFGRFMPEMGGDRRREARLLRGILLYGTIFVALFATGMCLFLGMTRSDVFPLRWLPILAIVMLAGKIQGTAFSFLYGRNEMGRFSMRELLRSAFTFLFVCGLYALTRSVDAALWALAINEVALMLLALWWGRNDLFQRLGPLPFREFKPYFLFGVTFYLPTILQYFLRSGPLLVREITHAFTDVGNFDLASQFLTTTNMVLGLVFTTLVPAFSKLHAANRTEEVLAWNRTALAWCAAIAFLAYGALTYLGRNLIPLVLGNDYADAYPMAGVIGLAFAPMLVSQMGMSFSVVRKKPSAFAASTVFGAVAMLGIAFLLIPSLQGVGAAWATVGAHTTVAVVYAAIFRRQFLSMLRDLALVAGLGLILMLPGIWLNESLFLMAAAFGAAVILYLAALAGLGILKPKDVLSAYRAIKTK